MKLPKRLETIANLVDNNVNVIDIGCDHGLLDIYLTLNKNNYCIATDINKNALNSAIKNIEKYKLKDKIQTRLSDGFDDIDIKNNTTAIISGMGTNTIISILKKADLSKISNLIIQSNNNLDELRKKIIKLGFYIENEVVIKEKKIFYVVIKFKKGYKKYNQFDYYYGPILKNKNYLLLLNQKIYNNIPKKYVLKIIKIKQKIKKLNKIKRT